MYELCRTVRDTAPERPVCGNGIVVEVLIREQPRCVPPDTHGGRVYITHLISPRVTSFHLNWVTVKYGLSRLLFACTDVGTIARMRSFYLVLYKLTITGARECSPVLTATHHFNGSSCDFPLFFSGTRLGVRPLNRSSRKMA